MVIHTIWREYSQRAACGFTLGFIVQAAASLCVHLFMYFAGAGGEMFVLGLSSGQSSPNDICGLRNISSGVL